MESRGIRNVGVRAALASAVLFGVGTPLAKLLLADASPWMLAGLLYTGAGVGLGLWRVVRRSERVRLRPRERWPLVGAVFCGGVVGPVLLLAGLANMPASGASLLLNAEGVFTALLAWVVFKEHWDRRVAFGFAAILAGAVVLSVPDGTTVGSAWPSLAVLGACLAWGVDNNLTRKISANDATWIAAVKGSVAGPVNLGLALLFGSSLPAAGTVAGAMVVGFFAYGVSLVLFILALRHVGTARAGAYFSVAPFFGTVVAIALGDAVTWPLVMAGLLMALGVWLHLRERHDHQHAHPRTEPLEWHAHDDAHGHDHEDDADAAPGWHRHAHVHEAVSHRHAHYPDSDHRHEH